MIDKGWLKSMKMQDKLNFKQYVSYIFKSYVQCFSQASENKSKRMGSIINLKKVQKMYYFPWLFRIFRPYIVYLLYKACYLNILN